MPRTCSRGDFGGCSASQARVWSGGFVKMLSSARARLSGANSVSLRHSSRRCPLKLSTQPFCIGLYGAM